MYQIIGLTNNLRDLRRFAFFARRCAGTGGDTLPPSRNPEGDGEIKGFFGGGQFAPKNSGKIFAVSGRGGACFPQVSFAEKNSGKIFEDFRKGVALFFNRVVFKKKFCKKFWERYTCWH